MKKNLLSMFYLLFFSFILNGLQGSLYFFPISMPFFWFIILTYYSFRKSLLFTLVTNLCHAVVIISFSSLPLSRLLIMMNLISFSFFIIRERFHTSQWHIAIASGTGAFIFLASHWIFQSLMQHFSQPPLFSWLGTSFLSFLFAFPLILILDKIDQKIQFERVDTLENLRI